MFFFFFLCTNETIYFNKICLKRNFPVAFDAYIPHITNTFLHVFMTFYVKWEVSLCANVYYVWFPRVIVVDHLFVERRTSQMSGTREALSRGGSSAEPPTRPVCTQIFLCTSAGLTTSLAIARTLWTEDGGSEIVCRDLTVSWVSSHTKYIHWHELYQWLKTLMFELQAA